MYLIVGDFMHDNYNLYDDILLLIDKLVQIENMKMNINNRNNDLIKQISEKEKLINNLKLYLNEFYAQSDEYKYFYEYKKDRTRVKMDMLYLEIIKLKCFFIDENIALLEERKIKDKLLSLFNMINLNLLDDSIFSMNSDEIKEQLIKKRKFIKK